MGGEETKQRRQVGEGGGKDRIQAGGEKDMRRLDNRRRAHDDKLKSELIQQIQISVACAVAILCEDKGVLIGVI